MRNTRKSIVSFGVGAALMAMAAHSAISEPCCEATISVPGEPPSLLPLGKNFKLVWHDEFDGDSLDESKWSYRTNFWGRR